MAEREDHFGPGRFRAFSPFLAPEERKKLHALFSFGEAPPPSFADALRSLARNYIDDGSSAKLRAICLLVADLFEQGWRVAVDEDQILFEPPGIKRTDGQTVEDVKARVRNALQSARQRQLREPSVATFLRRMERRTARPPGVRSSVLDLVDNGADLARELRRVVDLPEPERVAALASVVDPVVEICHSGAKCGDTGLPLIDIWRYFRHTWAHEYRPIPGRQLLILVRNAARRNRPVIGIAMLASPVMRVGVRDKWIGWLRDEAETRLQDGRWRPSAFAAALLARLEGSIAAVRWDDLATAAEIAEPTESTVLRLEQKASGAAFARELELRAHYEAQLAPVFRADALETEADFGCDSADEKWRARNQPIEIRGRRDRRQLVESVRPERSIVDGFNERNIFDLLLVEGNDGSPQSPLERIDLPQ